MNTGLKHPGSQTIPVPTPGPCRSLALPHAPLLQHQQALGPARGLAALGEMMETKKKGRMKH